ncbi:TetR/AcrR family transcriptional regulator [Phycicoccus sp. 3266]|uniref:TetR/AcrR family transcriptional regulator n=1 Tax=Phycicoccus sp. 3266 TaxID=2817751 RepID=UPI00285FB5AC|nr:TetR/AcrR family transcriptional regulator [Phycicoccus sp. 3266]MDR6861889.1 AcrR family transcriptional regulator [Phycicoccus sp. 3266]
MNSDSRTHRENMVYVAAQKLREQGVAGAALRTVAAEAGAPRGSLQHYFPGGKDQLVTEALAWAGGFAASRVTAYLERARTPSPSGLFTAVVREWVDELERRDFARGCPVAATVVDCAEGSEDLRRAAADALATWQRPLREGFASMGVPRRRAGSLAVLALSALEGAVILSRADHDTAPLRTVARELGPLLDAARP